MIYWAQGVRMDFATLTTTGGLVAAVYVLARVVDYFLSRMKNGKNGAIDPDRCKYHCPLKSNVIGIEADIISMKEKLVENHTNNTELHRLILQQHETLYKSVIELIASQKVLTERVSDLVRKLDR